MKFDSDEAYYPLRIVSFVLLLGVFVINGLATGLPLGGRSTQQLSDQFNVPFTPPGLVFSIWGVIYFFLAFFGIYQLMKRTLDNELINKGITPWFIANCLFNISWILAWQFQNMSVLWISLVFMFLILATLIAIYWNQEKYGSKQHLTWVQYFALYVPFAVYLGWIICASLINLFVVAGGYITPGMDASARSAILVGSCVSIALVAVIAIGMFWRRRDGIPSAVFCWACIGIYRDKIAPNKIRSDVYPEVAYTALAVAVITGLLFLADIGLGIRYIIKNRRS